MSAFSQIGTKALTIAAIIVGAVVAMILISTLYPTYGGAVANLSDNITNTDLGDSTANALRGVFALLVALGGLFAIVGLVFLSFKLSSK